MVLVWPGSPPSLECAPLTSVSMMGVEMGGLWLRGEAGPGWGTPIPRAGQVGGLEVAAVKGTTVGESGALCLPLPL